MESWRGFLNKTSLKENFDNVRAVLERGDVGSELLIKKVLRPAFEYSVEFLKDAFPGARVKMPSITTREGNPRGAWSSYYADGYYQKSREDGEQDIIFWIGSWEEFEKRFVDKIESTLGEVPLGGDYSSGAGASYPDATDQGASESDAAEIRLLLLDIASLLTGATMIHELYHHLQYIHYGDRFKNPKYAAAIEEKAHNFGLKFMEEFAREKLDIKAQRLAGKVYYLLMDMGADVEKLNSVKSIINFVDDEINKITTADKDWKHWYSEDGESDKDAFKSTYKVKKGDSLYKIAKKFKLSRSILVKANPQIKNINKIYVGDKIIIPNERDIEDTYQVYNSAVAARSKPKGKDS